MSSNEFLKGRGAQKNTDNRFLQHVFEMRDDFLEFCRLEGEEYESNKTGYFGSFCATHFGVIVPGISV